jgi:hypothetical protein
VVFGTVVGIHIKDEFLTEDGRVDVLKITPCPASATSTTRPSIRVSS